MDNLYKNIVSKTIIVKTYLEEPKHTDKDIEKFQALSYLRFIKQFKFLAYSNEVGETIRHTFPYLVKPAYALSFGYILADIGYHIYPIYHKENGFGKKTQEELKYYSTWHSIASLAIPTIAIGGTIKVAKKLMVLSHVKVHYIRWALPIIGIGMIPLIINPIDELVERRVMYPYFPQQFKHKHPDKFKLYQSYKRENDNDPPSNPPSNTHDEIVMQRR